MQTGGKISTEGYKKGSPDRNQPFLQIPSGNISMKNVDKKVLGIDNLGHKKVMSPNFDYYYPGKTVYELPVDNLDEKKYQKWRKSLPKRLQSEVDYDLKGFYKENPNFNVEDPNQHMTDKFKLPNHPTFSNESIHFNPSNQDQAGMWYSNMYLPYNPGQKQMVVEPNFQKGGEYNPYQKNIGYLNTIPMDPKSIESRRYHPESYLSNPLGMTGQEKFLHNQKTKYRRREEGYSDDGELSPSQKLIRNKHYRGFAENIVEPTVALADVYGIAGLAKTGAKKILTATADNIPYTGGFPMSTIKKAKGNTAMPTQTIVPELNKEQKILESFGINPYSGRLSNSDQEFLKELYPDKGFTKSFKPKADMFLTKGPSGKGEIFNQGIGNDLSISKEFYPVSTYGQPHKFNDDVWHAIDPEDYKPSDNWMIKRDVSDNVEGVLKQDYDHYTKFGPTTPYQRMFEGKGMPDVYTPTVRQKNKFGGQIKNDWLKNY